MTREEIVEAVLVELKKAENKFPTWPIDPMHASVVVSEEVGEMIRELNMFVYEPHRSSKEDIKKEAIQATAMLIRFMLYLDKYNYNPCQQS